MRSHVLHSRPNTPSIPQTPIFPATTQPSPSTMMLLSPIFGQLVQCIFCAPTVRPTSFSFFDHFCRHHFCIRHRYSNQHHNVRTANRSQRKIVQSPGQFPGYPALYQVSQHQFHDHCEDDWRLWRSWRQSSAHPNFVRRDRSPSMRFSYNFHSRLQQSIAIENKTHTLQLQCLEGRSMVHMVERFLHVQLYHHNSLCHSRDSSAAFNSKNNPSSACVFGTNAVCSSRVSVEGVT